MSVGESVGVILSGATTQRGLCQLFKDAEKGGIIEGMLLMVTTSNNQRILARVDRVVPYNEFFEAGDIMTEARREKRNIPSDIARQYEICELEFLTLIPKGEIRYPPLPGDLVWKIDPSKLKNYKEEIFGVSPDLKVGEDEYKGIVDLGVLSGYSNLFVPINIEKLPMHVAIFGVTGSGKSFTMGYFLERLMNIPKDRNKKTAYPIIIVDAHGDYINYVDHVLDNGGIEKTDWMKAGDIKRFVFPRAYNELIYKRQWGSCLDRIGISLDRLSSTELAKMIVIYHKGSIEGADQQIHLLTDFIDYLKYEAEQVDSSLNDYFTEGKDELLQKLDGFAGSQASLFKPTINAVKNQLKTFLRLEKVYDLFSSDSELTSKTEHFVDRVTSQRALYIIDFSADGAPGVDIRTKQIVIGYLASVLFERFTYYRLKGEPKYLLFAIEEAQNFCPNKNYPIGASIAHEILSSIATQGRKFGLSLCLISQRPSFLDEIVLSMCNSFVIHRISPADLSFVIKVTGGLPKSLREKLTNLETGKAILSGQFLTVPYPLLVSIPKNGRVVPPSIEAKVVDHL